jgi:hypothetical protein
MASVLPQTAQQTSRRYNEKRWQDNEAAWYAFHLSQAERIERTAAQLAAVHRARAEALAEERRCLVNDPMQSEWPLARRYSMQAGNPMQYENPHAI